MHDLYTDISFGLRRKLYFASYMDEKVDVVYTTFRLKHNIITSFSKQYKSRDFWLCMQKLDIQKKYFLSQND